MVFSAIQVRRLRRLHQLVVVYSAILVRRMFSPFSESQRRLHRPAELERRVSTVLERRVPAVLEEPTNFHLPLKVSQYFRHFCVKELEMEWSNIKL